LSPALTAKNNEIEQLKARIMELEEKLTSACNTARELKDRIAELEGGTEIKARCQEARQAYAGASSRAPVRKRRLHEFLLHGALAPMILPTRQTPGRRRGKLGRGFNAALAQVSHQQVETAELEIAAEDGPDPLRLSVIDDDLSTLGVANNRPESRYWPARSMYVKSTRTNRRSDMLRLSAKSWIIWC